MKLALVAAALLVISSSANAQTNGKGGDYLNDIRPSFRCELEVKLGNRIIEEASNKDGMEEVAMKAANISIRYCGVAARQFGKSLVKMLGLALDNCDAAAKLGQSQYSRAACYNKTAELVAQITI